MIVMVRLILVWFLHQRECFLLPIRMSYPPQRKVWLSTNSCATVIVGTWDAQPKGFKTESNSMFPNGSDRELPTFRPGRNLLDHVSRQRQNLNVILSLDNISWKAVIVLRTSTTLCSQFLPLHIPNSIFVFWRQCLSKRNNVHFVGRKSLCFPFSSSNNDRCALSTLGALHLCTVLWMPENWFLCI